MALGCAETEGMQMAPFADDFIERHFQEWMARHVQEGLQADVSTKIRALVATDPEYYGSKSWPELRDISEGN